MEENQLWSKNTLLAWVQMVTSYFYLEYFLLIKANFINLESRHEQAQFGDRAEMGKY